MKLKDYFTRLKNQAKLGGEDLDKFLEGVPDGEISAVVTNLFEENFLTKERAATDKEILKKIKAEVYNGVDANIAELLPSLPRAEQDLINAENDTHKKLKMLDAGYKKQYEELKKSAPDAVKISEENAKTIRELTERLEVEKTEREKVVKNQDKTIKEITAQKDKELKSYKIKSDLVGKLGQLEFAKEFTEPTVKDMFFNGILERIMKNDLDYNEDGHIVVQEISNGVPKPKFFAGTNDLMTVEKLLETETAPFIKRNNAEPPTQKTTPRVVTQVPQQGQTLAQRRAAMATD